MKSLKVYIVFLNEVHILILLIKSQPYEVVLILKFLLI